MGARAREEQRPLQSREPPGLRGCCVSPFPSQERAPKNVPQITLPPASPPAGSSRTGGQTDPAAPTRAQAAGSKPHFPQAQGSPGSCEPPAQDQIKVQGNGWDVSEFSEHIIYNAEKCSAAIHHGARQLPGRAVQPSCVRGQPSCPTTGMGTQPALGKGAGIGPRPAWMGGTARPRGLSTWILALPLVCHAMPRASVSPHARQRRARWAPSVLPGEAEEELRQTPAGG